MQLSCYRIRRRTNKYYMYIVYYGSGISITNAWLYYRRYQELRRVQQKEIMWLLCFQLSIAYDFCHSYQAVPPSKEGKTSPNSSCTSTSQTTTSTSCCSCSIQWITLWQLPRIPYLKGKNLVGQKWPNFRLVTKILSDQKFVRPKFCPTKRFVRPKFCPIHTFGNLLFL